MSSNKKNKAPKLAGSHIKLGSVDMPDDDADADDADDDFDPKSSMVEVVCLQGGAKFAIAGRRYKMRPGDIAQVEGAYGTPRLMRPGSDPLPSVVELLTGRKVLPVLDPRVDKDANGEPLIAVQARESRANRARATAQAGA